jgi:hypothetical protein
MRSKKLAAFLRKRMRHVDILLPDYVRGTLGQEEREAVALHLSSCPTCREEEKEIRALFENIAGLPEPGAPEGYFYTLLTRIRTRIELGKENAGIGWQLVNRLLLPIGVGVAAVLLVVNLSVIPPEGKDAAGSIRGTLETADVLDALLNESFTQPWNAPPVERVDDLVSVGSLAKGLIRGFDEMDSHSSAVLFSGAVELSDREADVLLQRLNERKIL